MSAPPLDLDYLAGAGDFWSKVDRDEIHAARIERAAAAAILSNGIGG